jgi:NADP-dependent 3-hydroxy acid dehydrogenase YdfG
MSGTRRIQVFRAEQGVPLAESGIMAVDPGSADQQAGLERMAAAGVGDGEEIRVLVNMPGFTLAHVWFKAHFPLPLHSHDADCLYYVIAGSLELGAETLGPRDSFFVPAGAAYAYVPGPDGVELLEFRHAERFDFRNHAKGAAFYARAAETIAANRDRWRSARPPSRLPVRGATETDRSALAGAGAHDAEDAARPLRGRVALITGASSGIGEGAALALAAQGVKLFVTGRRAERLEDLKARIEAAGGACAFVAGDITDEDFARSLIDLTVQRYGRLDILVNSAGSMYYSDVEHAKGKLWREAMELNLFATIYTCSAAIPVMRAQGGGDIVNISSTAGRRLMGGPYGASKIALTSFNEGLRQEASPQGIRVSIIEPGATSSDIWEKIPDAAQREVLRTHINKDGAMKPQDIAAAIVLVCALPQRTNLCEILIRPTMDVKPGVGV